MQKKTLALIGLGILVALGILVLFPESPKILERDREITPVPPIGEKTRLGPTTPPPIKAPIK